MDIRNLRLFRHLAGTLHFARTSQACHITPSALTRVIQRMESDLGEKLFLRGSRAVELTQAGETFKRYADDVLSRFDRLHDELSGDMELSGKLAIFCSVTAAYGILPELMRKYREAHPNVQILLETGDPAKALARLAHQDADAVIAAMPDAAPGDLVFKPLAMSPLVFIAPRHYPDAVVRKEGGIDWEETPLIIPDRGPSRDRIDQWFADEHFVPKIYSQVAGNEAIIVMVSLGCGLGLVPRLVLENSPFLNDVNILDDTPRLRPFVIGLAARKKSLSNPRVRALWDIAGDPAPESPSDTSG